MEAFESMGTIQGNENSRGGRMNHRKSAMGDRQRTLEKKYVPTTIKWVILSRREHLGVQAKGTWRASWLHIDLQ